jgi:predicted Zn-dependent protease
MRPIRFAALCCLLALPLAAQEQDPNRRTIEGIKQTLTQRPDDPTLYYYLAAFQARVGDKADALASLDKLARIGEGFLPTAFIGFDKI